MNGKTKEPLLQFPTDFTIKVFGKDDDAFTSTVLDIIRQHVKDLPDDAVQTRKSEKENYKAISITIRAESREQLDNIYRALSAAPEVIMAL